MNFTVEQITALVLAAGAVVGLWFRARAESKKMGVLEFKVDVMWQAQLRRAQAEAVIMGHGKIESPFTAHPEAADLFGPLLVEMKDYMDRVIKKPLRDAEIIMLLENEFGEKVTKQVCIPAGFSQLGCMIIALSLIRSGPVTIETGSVQPTAKIVKALADAPVLDAALIASQIAGGPSVAKKLDNIVDETKKQTVIIERAADEVHEIHEEVRDIHDSGVLKVNKG